MKSENQVNAPCYLNFRGPVPANIVLELALADRRPEGVVCMSGTQRGSGETYSTSYGMISGYEDLDLQYDSD